MSSLLSILATKKPISTREFQQNFTKARESEKALEVISNGNSVGVFIPTTVWDELIENWQAQESASFHKKIQQARKEARQGEIVEGGAFLSSMQ